MKSVTVVTKEIDDARIAADELVAALKERLEPAENMIGVLYYDYEMQSDDLVGHIKEAYDLDIVGCSTIAALDGKEGYHEMAAVLTVMAADDCGFSAALSGPLTRENAVEQVLAAYDDARSRLSLEPKLIFALPPCGVDIAADKIVDALSEKAGRIPIIGGVPSSTGAVEKSMLFNENSYSDRCILLLMGGEIQPVFSVGNVISELSDKCCTVTKVEDTIIREVNGGKTFVRFIEEYGMNVADIAGDEGRTFFQRYPLLIKDDALAGSDGAPYARIVEGVDLKNGSGTTFACVPQGAQAALAILKREDIGVSARNAMRDLLAQICEKEAEGHKYSTVFCVTCAARHFIMNPMYNAEGNSVTAQLPANLNLNGFYSYGEICPTSVRNGKATNRLHNASIVLCAV